MKRTVHEIIQSIAVDEQGQSLLNHFFTNLLHLLYLATVFLLLPVFVGSAHAWKSTFYYGPGDDIFKERSAEIAHPAVLEKIVGKVKARKGQRSLSIMVSCLEEDGGKGLSRARASMLESYFKDRFKKGIQISTKNTSRKKPSKEMQEEFKKIVAQMPGKMPGQMPGKSPGSKSAVKTMMGDFVRITGEDGSTVVSGNDEQFEEIDARIKEAESDWQRDLLRRYRKVMQTMSALCAQTIPKKIYENCSNLKGKARYLCYQRVNLSRDRHELEEVTRFFKQKKLLYNKQAQEVNGIVQEIVKHKPDVKAPVYDEKVGRRAVEDAKLAVKYMEQTVETARYGLEYLQQILGSHAISDPDFWHLQGAFKSREVPLWLYTFFVCYQSHNDFIEEQQSLNIFIKRHLGLRDCPSGFGCLPVCFEGWLGHPTGATPANLTLHRLTKEEIIEMFRYSRQEWIEKGIPELEFDIRQP